jgi:hypothetical protein
MDNIMNNAHVLLVRMEKSIMVLVGHNFNEDIGI